MKCKVCKKEINITIAGMTNDICINCLHDQQRKEATGNNKTIINFIVNI